jgi:phage gp29-like protein
MPDKKESKISIPSSVKVKATRYNEMSTLTPTNLFTALDSNDNLQVQAAIEKMFCKEDPDLLGHRQTRLALAQKAIVNVTPADDSPQSQEVAEFCHDLVKKYFKPEVMKNVLDCNFRVFSVQEIIWQIEEGKIIPESVKSLDRTGFEFKCDKDDNPIPELALYDAEKGIYSEIPANKCIVSFSSLTLNNMPITILRPIARYFIIKYFNVTDWSVFNEVFGMPFMLAKYDPVEMTDPEIVKLYNMMKNLASDSRGVVNNKSEIQVIESKHQSPATYMKLLDTCDQKEAVGILGQHNTSGIKDSGSRAALEILNQIKEDIIVSDFSILEAAISEFINCIIYYNFDKKYTPSVEIQLPADYSKKAELAIKLKNAGAKLKKEYFARRFDLEDDEFDIVEASEPDPDQNPGLMTNAKKKSKTPNPYF